MVHRYYPSQEKMFNSFILAVRANWIKWRLSNIYQTSKCKYVHKLAADAGIFENKYLLIKWFV